MHESGVPRDFATAVYKIMHNQAGYEEWEHIDQYFGEQKPIFDWIRSVLQSNKVVDIEDEMNWWKQQISRPHN